MSSNSIVNAKPLDSSRGSSIIWIILLLCLVAGAVAYFTVFRNDSASSREAKSAVGLLVVDVEKAPEGVLPHTVDQATEFKESLEYLKEGAEAPEYRDTPAAAKVVPDELAAETKELVKKEAAVEIITVEVPQVAPKKQPEESAKKAQDTVVEIAKGSATQAVGAETNQKVEVPQGIELDANSTVLLQVNRDWDGVVLVPDNVKLARAYTTNIRFARIEAHPLDDGRIRVWSRIENLTGEDMSFNTACEFRFRSRRAAPYTFREITIPKGSAIDVKFESVDKGVNAYTLMVK